MDSNPPNSPPAQAVRVLKKYPNRRLYDSHSSSYVTLADVKNMVVEGTAFRVVDAKTGENLTRSILLQIILEEETAGAPLFSETMLRVLIRVYGQAMHGSLGTWLEHSLGGVAKMQDALGAQWQAQMDQLSHLPGAAPFTGLPGGPGFTGLPGGPGFAGLPPIPGLPAMPAIPGMPAMTGVGAALPGADWMQQVSAQWQAQQDQLRQTSEQFFASFQPPGVAPVPAAPVPDTGPAEAPGAQQAFESAPVKPAKAKAPARPRTRKTAPD